MNFPSPEPAAIELPGAPPLALRVLPLSDYVDVLGKMKKQCQQRRADSPDEIWLLQHRSVIALGPRSRASDVLPGAKLPLAQTDRGGQTTCHGPGQLMLYALLDLRRRKMRVKELIAMLENAVIDCCRRRGVFAERTAHNPGVFVGGAKIAFLGLRVYRGCSYHGVAFNVRNDLSCFANIVCCGVAKQKVVRLCDLADADLNETAVSFLRCFVSRLQGSDGSRSHSSWQFISGACRSLV